MADSKKEAALTGSKDSNRKLSLLRQFCACGYIFWTPIVFGLISKQKKHFSTVFQSSLSKDKNMLIFSSAELIGSLLAGISSHFIGRKPNVIFANILNLAAPICLSVGYENVTGFMGVAIGLTAEFFAYVAFLVHIVEVTDTTFRAFFVGFVCLGFNLGSTAGEIMAAQWTKNVSAFCCLVIGGALAFSYAVPETPFYLALNGRRAEAERMFTWLRAGTSDASELNAMLGNAEISAKRTHVAANIFSRRVGIPSLLLWIALLTFVYPHTYHNAAFDIFVYPNFGIRGWLKFKLPTSKVSVFGYDKYEFFKLIAPVSGSLIFLALNFAIPRKTLFVGSFVFSIISFLVYPYYADPHSRELLVYSATFALLLTHAGTVPVLNVISAEIFPDNLRQLGPVICSSFIAVSRIIRWDSDYADTFPILDVYIIIFCFYLPIGLVFTFLFMPETKGLTLAEAEKAASDITLQEFRIL